MAITIDKHKLLELRRIITENLRIQRGGGKSVPYIDTSGVMVDVCAKQNHTIFARRGCGKTLLLEQSAKHLGSNTKSVYLNCEDFKRHSFPNVLIEILDALFRELEKQKTGWFGRKKRSKQLIQEIRNDLANLKVESDVGEESIRERSEAKAGDSVSANIGVSDGVVGVRAQYSANDMTTNETERTYKIRKVKLAKLDLILPKLKEHVREFFEVSSTVKTVFLQIDDFYHLKRSDQPFVADYIHRLCKDVPLFFKIATLRHASTLYIDRDGQPIGAQERHDYQPVNIDYTFSDFKRTSDQNLKILYEFAKLAHMSIVEVNSLFKGEGFQRLVMAGGGVPRDTLSLFIEVLSQVLERGGDGIGKDDVRILSRSNFDRRVDELKHDSEGRDQDVLLKGIYVLRDFCLNKKTNVFLISERLLQQHDQLKNLVHRLLDYRIIHHAANALTHKSQEGTYQAYAIDIGCYAHLRKLDGRFVELDVAANDFKERLRSAPIFESSEFEARWVAAPQDVEAVLLNADPL